MCFTAGWYGLGEKDALLHVLPANWRHEDDPGRGPEGGPCEIGCQTVCSGRSGLDWPKLTGFESACPLDQVLRF
jgi:hypothetical protein